MSTLDTAPWPRRFCCYVCERGVHATIRVFSGTYGGGFPACDEHANKAISQALEPLGGPHVASDYVVTAYEVVTRDGWPAKGRTLWHARMRIPLSSPESMTPKRSE